MLITVYIASTRSKKGKGRVPRALAAQSTSEGLVETVTSTS